MKPSRPRSPGFSEGRGSSVVGPLCLTAAGMDFLGLFLREKVSRMEVFFFKFAGEGGRGPGGEGWRYGGFIFEMILHPLF